MMIKLLIPTLILTAFCLVALSVRVIFKKNGHFSRRCASEAAGGSCACKGTDRKPIARHEDCPLYELHHGNTATQTAAAVKMADEK